MPITEESVRREARNLPEHMQDGAIGYVLYGSLPGSFFTAVLCNNLIDAATNADEQNKHALYAWAVFVYNAVPMPARGSWGAISQWNREGGLLRGQRT